jgi:sigma-B regulation protein RsbQ
MSVRFRNNVHVAGSGPATIVFIHGFGCDQTMWRYLAPVLEERYRIVTYDLVGCGESDLQMYDRDKYATLHGHVDDLFDILESCAHGPVVLVGHSVGAMIGMLATIRAPARFAAQVMLSPSPCFINDGDYIGGFNPEDLQTLLATMEDNFLGWSMNVAPLITGGRHHPALTNELTRRFCRNDAAIMRHFARVTFLSDHRADLPRSSVPALVLQCSDDLLVPPLPAEAPAEQHPARGRQRRPLSALERPERQFHGARRVPGTGLVGSPGGAVDSASLCRRNRDEHGTRAEQDAVDRTGLICCRGPVPERPQQPQRHCGHWIVICFLAVPAMMSSWEGNAMKSARRRHRQTGWPDWRPIMASLTVRCSS